MKETNSNNTQSNENNALYRLMNEEKDAYYVSVLVKDIDDAYGAETCGEEFYRIMGNCPSFIQSTIVVPSSFSNKGYAAFPCKNKDDAEKTVSYITTYTRMKNPKVSPLADLGRSNRLNIKRSLVSILCLAAPVIVLILWFVFGR